MTEIRVFSFCKTIERIGVFRDPVVSWQEAHGEPAPPRVQW